MIPLRFSGFTIFQPTRPLRGATGGQGGILSLSPYFNPRAPCGARPTALLKSTPRPTDFNPRAPCGARQTWQLPAKFPKRFQPTRPLRGATGFVLRGLWDGGISTHAPLAGRDRLECSTPISSINFNPRAPCGARLLLVLILFPFIVISTHAPLAGRDSKSVQITMHIFAITDKFQMLLHRMPPVRAFCSFLMQENHADFGCEPPK